MFIALSSFAVVLRWATFWVRLWLGGVCGVLYSLLGDDLLWFGWVGL